MKFYFYSALTALLFVFFVSCKPMKPVVVKDFKGAKIEFGGGGGFAGIGQSFVLLENGQLFQLAIDGKETFLVALKGAALKQLFSNSRRISHLESFNKPGNTYKFIHVIDSKKNTKKFTWGDQFSAPKELVIFHQILSKYTSK